MFTEFLQFLLSGITVGATYALVGVGFSIIYNASQVINFAQGEFVMLGGMMTWFLFEEAGLPMPAAVPLAITGTVMVGLALEKFAIEPARNASIVTLIIITIGASIFLRGGAQLVWGRDFHAVPALSGDTPINLSGVALNPQSLWVVGCTLVVIVLLHWFFSRTMTGRAMRAVAFNMLAAQLAGVNNRLILMFSFGLSAALGALAGVLIAPITLTYPDVGIMLGLKGFCAAILGGLGYPYGAIVGGLVVGISEAMTAGYVSSAYKDAVAFVIILLTLFFMPNGLFGRRGVERV
jgi:branched-chain amino acid transport system permease protein